MDKKVCLNQVNFCLQKKETASKLNDALNENTANIIQMFGGMTNVVRLCLTSTNFNDFVENQSLEHLSQILIAKDLINTADITDDNNHNHNDTQGNLPDQENQQIHTQSAIPSIQQQTALQVANLSFDNVDIATDDTQNPNDNTNHGFDSTNEVTKSKSYQISLSKDTPDMNLGGKYDITTNSLQEYDKSRIIMIARKNKNLFFLIFKNREKLYEIISSRQFYVIVVGLAVLFLIISEFFWILPQNILDSMGGWVYIFWLSWYMCCLCMIIGGICCMLIANVTIMICVMQTFDFWFKLFSSVSGIVSYWVLGVISTDSGVDIDDGWELIAGVFGWIMFVLIIAVIFMMDALLISIKIKKILITLAALYLMYSAIYWYFTAKDVLYNPFEFKHSQISFKSILLSSLVNVSFFVAKPLFSDVIKYMKRKFNHYKNINNSNSGTGINSQIQLDKDIEKCYTIYKRPYIQWSMARRSISNSRIHAQIAN